MTEAQRGVIHGGNLSCCQLQHLQSGFLRNPFQSHISQIYNAVKIEVIHNLLCQGIAFLQEACSGCTHLINLRGNLLQTVQIECQAGCHIHVGKS